MDQYPLLLSHMGTNDTTSQRIGRIKEDYKVLARQVTNTGAQVIFSPIFLVTEIGTARSHAVQIDVWLPGCHQGFGFYNTGLCLNDCSLLERDGIHLFKKGQENPWQHAGQLSDMDFRLQDSGGEVQSDYDHSIASF